MNKLLIVWTLIFAFIASQALSAEDAVQETHRPFKSLFQDIILVDAEVISQEARKSHTVSVLKVGHVYAGEKKPEFKTFDATTETGGFDIHGRSIDPLPEIGEKGIWVVGYRDDKLCNAASGVWLGNGWPARESVTKRYAQMKQLAEAVEKAYSAQAEEEWPMLKKYALSEVPEVSVWAITSIAKMDGEEAKEFLMSLVPSEKLAVQSQLALEWELQLLQWDEWRGSNEQTALVERMVSAKLSPRYADAVGSRIKVLVQQKQINDVVLLDLAGKAFENETMSSRGCFAILQAIGSSQIGKDQKAGFFTLLKSVLDSEREGYVKNAAAWTISFCKPLTPDQVSEITKLRKETEDKMLAKALDKVLRDSE